MCEKVDTNLNTCCSECTKRCSVPHARVILWICSNIFPQLTALQICIVQGHENTMILFTIHVSCCTCLYITTAYPLPWKHNLPFAITLPWQYRCNFFPFVCKKYGTVMARDT
jgi:hypothetical protein